MPKTRLGKWSVQLVFVFFLLFATLRLLVASGQQGGATFFSNPVLSIPGLLMGISGAFAFVVGIAAIGKRKERSSLVFLSTVIGLVVLIFLLGEMLSSH